MEQCKEGADKISPSRIVSILIFSSYVISTLFVLYYSTVDLLQLLYSFASGLATYC